MFRSRISRFSSHSSRRKSGGHRLLQPSWRTSWLAAALVSALLLNASFGMAQTIAYTITGTISGTNYVDLDFGSFEPDGDPPFAAGVPYVLTFDLDLASPLTQSGPTFAIYGDAVTNLLLDIDAGAACVSAVVEGITQTFVPGSQSWAPGAVSAGPGCEGTIPDFNVIDPNTLETQTTTFIGFEAPLLRFDGGFYDTFPPGLIAPELADAESAFIELRFMDVSGSPMPAFMGIQGSIDSISTPEPGLSTLLGCGGVLLAASARRRGRGRTPGIGVTSRRESAGTLR